jgi:hypothetical protein
MSVQSDTSFEKISEAVLDLDVTVAKHRISDAVPALVAYKNMTRVCGAVQKVVISSLSS